MINLVIGFVLFGIAVFMTVIAMGFVVYAILMVCEGAAATWQHAQERDIASAILALGFFSFATVMAITVAGIAGLVAAMVWEGVGSILGS